MGCNLLSKGRWIKETGCGHCDEKKLAESLVTYEQICPRVIKTTHDVEEGQLAVFQMYAPECL